MKSIASFGHFVSGSAFYSLSQWIMLMLLVKTTDPEVVGQFGLALAICAPLILFANMHMRTVLSTDISDKFRFAEYLRLRFTTTGIFFVTLMIVVSLSEFSTQTKGVILLLAACKSVESVSDLLYGFFNKHGCATYISHSMFIKGILSITSFAIGLYYFSSLLFSLTLLSIAWLCSLLLFDFSNLKKIKTRFPSVDTQLRGSVSSSIMPMIILGFPLALVALLDSFNSFFPRYLLQATCGDYSVGIFTALYYVIMAGNTIVNALAQTLNPKLAKLIAEGKREQLPKYITQYLTGGIVIGIVPVIFAYPFGEQFLRYIYADEYASYNNEFLMVLIGGLFAYCAMLMWHINVTLRAIRNQPLVSLATLVSTIALGIALVPNYGVMGAALAMSCGRFVQFFGNLALLRIATRQLA